MGERGLLAAAGEVIADIRNKLVDEGWFGRHGPTEPAKSSLDWESNPPKPRTAEELGAHLSFDEAWATNEPTDKLSPEYDRSIGIDH